MPLVFLPAARRGLPGDFAVPDARRSHRHAVYVLDFAALGAPSPLARARRTGARELVRVPGRAARSLEIPAHGGRASGIVEQQGDPVRTFAAAVARLERDPRVRGGRFEVRLLREPASGLRAVWLHGRGEDFLACLTAPPPPMRLLRVYDADPVLAAYRAARMAGGALVDPAPASKPPTRSARTASFAEKPLRPGESPADRTTTRRRPS